jgi:methionine-S-sulfoxide reductase
VLWTHLLLQAGKKSLEERISLVEAVLSSESESNNALRRLPGVIETWAGYAGGHAAAPTYQQVCTGETEHAEVVKVGFDPVVLNPRILLDCFLSLHDPTKVRAQGKHAVTGQYRSCIFVDPSFESVVQLALHDCQAQLDKELSTQVKAMSGTEARAGSGRQRKDTSDTTINDVMK